MGKSRKRLKAGTAQVKQHEIYRVIAMQLRLLDRIVRNVFVVAALSCCAVGGCSNNPNSSKADSKAPLASAEPSAEQTSKPPNESKQTPTEQSEPTSRSDQNHALQVTPLSPVAEIDAAVAKKLAEREELDKTLWAEEVQAQKHEEFLSICGIGCVVPSIGLPYSANCRFRSLACRYQERRPA